MQTLGDQSALPPPDAIREAAREVISRPYFDLDAASRQDVTPFLLRLIEWMMKPFRWLFDSMEGWPDFVRWIVVVVSLLVCVALIAHIIYSFVAAIRGPAARRRQQYTAALKEVDPAELERQAEHAGNGGDYIGAIRLLFRAALRRLEVAEKRKIRPGSTNQEIVRRYRSTPISSSLERFANTIERKWYGGEPCVQQDYLTCSNEHAQIRAYVQATRPAVGT